MIWYSHLLKNFPQFVVIHTVTGFSTVNEAEVDVFLEFCFFYDSVDVVSLISGSSAFSKSSLNIWKFLVQVLLKLSESESISCSDMSDLCTPWTVTHQAPLGFSRQEYWSGLSFPSPGDIPDPGIETQVSRIAGSLSTVRATREAQPKPVCLVTQS